MLLPFLTALIVAAPAQTWELSPPYKKGEKMEWNTSISAESPDGSVQVTLTYVLHVAEVSEKETRGNVRFVNLEVDGMVQEDLDEYDLRLGPRGNASASQSEFGDAFRRMSAPMFFVYPESKVGVGDKWSFEFKGSEGGKFTYKCEAKSEEKFNDKEALKVSMTATEDAGDRTSSEGIYWLGRDGKVLKFEIRIQNWVVPMAGGQAIGATLVGVLK